MELMTACTLFWIAFSINTDIWELLILHKKHQTVTFSRRHWNRKYLFQAGEKSFVIHKVLKFLMIHCLTRKLKILVLSYSTVTLLHSERPNLFTILAILSAKGLNRRSVNVVSAGQCDLMSDKWLESHEQESHAMRVQQLLYLACISAQNCKSRQFSFFRFICIHKIKKRKNLIRLRQRHFGSVLFHLNAMMLNQRRFNPDFTLPCSLCCKVYLSQAI